MSPPGLLVCQVSHTGLQGEVYEEDEEDDEEHNDEDYNQYYPAIEFVVKAHIILTDPFTLNNNSNQWRVEWSGELLPRSLSLSHRSWRRDTTHSPGSRPPGRPCRTGRTAGWRSSRGWSCCSCGKGTSLPQARPNTGRLGRKCLHYD